MIDLTTTNVLLGIMAVVSLLEAMALIAAGIMGLKLYRELTQQVRVVEERHVAPLAAQAAALSVQAQSILQTVQRISERVEHSTATVDEAVQGTVHTAEAAVDKVQGGMRKTAGTIIGVVRGVRTAIETFLTSDGPNGAGPYERRANGHGTRTQTPPPRPAPPTAEPF